MGLLKLGSSGLQVVKLIADLNRAGFPVSGVVGNVFDSEVKKAVLRFQSQGMGPDGLPLVVDGEVGPLTQYALDVALSRRQAVPPKEISAPAVEQNPEGASKVGLQALAIAKAEMAKGAGEEGSDNNGPFVKKYADVAGASAGDSWCASFVSFCFSKANGKDMPFKPSAGARDILRQFQKHGWRYNADLDNPPCAGDIIVWWREAIDSWKGHIGIVSGYSDGIVYTIEGNRGSFPSKVRQYQYKLGKIDKLLGFGRARP